MIINHGEALCHAGSLAARFILSDHPCRSAYHSELCYKLCQTPAYKSKVFALAGSVEASGEGVFRRRQRSRHSPPFLLTVYPAGRWKCSASLSGESATSILLPERVRDCYLVSKSECMKGSADGEKWVRSTDLVEAIPGSPQQQAQTSTADEDQGDQYCRRNVEGGLQRFAETAAVSFRRQREKLSILQMFVGWRRTAALERSRRNALSRLARRRYLKHLGGSFGRWRMVTEHQRIEEALAAARKVGEDTARTWLLEEGLKRDRDEMTERTIRREHRLQDAAGTARSYSVATAAAAMAAESAAAVVTEEAAKEMEAEVAELTRGRVRDMQTIAELKVTVQALQAEAKAKATNTEETTLALEEKVKRDRDTLVELRGTVEALQAEVKGPMVMT